MMITSLAASSSPPGRSQVHAQWSHVEGLPHAALLHTLVTG